MSRFAAGAVLAFALVPSPVFAQFGGMGGGMAYPPWLHQEYSVKVETVEGRNVSGTLPLASVVVECDLGLYHVKPEKVKAVRFLNPKEHVAVRGPDGTRVPGAVATVSGEEITGTIIVPTWMLTTDLGAVVLDPAKLKSLTLVGKTDPSTPKPGNPASPAPK